MLRLSDFVTGREKLYNLSRVLCISASKRCRKMTFRKYVHLTQVSKIYFNCHSDFMVCSTSV